MAITAITFIPTAITDVKAAEAIAAFPGAEGGGKFATGGRGGTVYHVTNLNDSGPGSFRDAVSGSNRIVVFDVGGTIELKSDVVIKSNVTVAGQTAPGGHGVTLKNYKVGLGGSNIILRYISSRPGERGTTQDYDALGGSDGSGSIIDHCAFGWANDEQWGLYSNNDMYTTQWSIIGPSNSFSYHSKGIHGFGIMFGKSNTTWHHNLIAHNISRNFRGKVAGTNTAEFVNNVIYNWGYQTAYGTLGHLNYVGNYLKKGAKTTGDRYISISSGSGYENFRFYMTGNKLVDKNDSPVIKEGEEWDKGINYGSSGYTKDSFYSASPFKITNNSQDIAYVNKAESADEAYNSVTSFVGPAIDAASRTEIDAQVINETLTGTGSLTGGRPLAQANSTQKSEIDKYGIAYTTYNYPTTVTKDQAGEKYTDTDSDGMPDWWELERGLDPYSNTKAETNGDYCGQGYTNIEYYINDLTINSFPEGTVTLSPTVGAEVTVDPKGTDSDATGAVVRTTIAKAMAYLEASDSQGTKTLYIKDGTYNDDITVRIDNVTIAPAEGSSSVSVRDLTVNGKNFNTESISYKSITENGDCATFTKCQSPLVRLANSSRSYFTGCTISGADGVIDSQNAQAVFEGCTITSTGVIANISTPRVGAYGVMFKDSSLTGTGIAKSADPFVDACGMAAAYGCTLAISGSRYSGTGMVYVESGCSPADASALSETDFLNRHYGPYNFTKGSYGKSDDGWNPGGWDTQTPQESLKALADSISLPSVVTQNTAVTTSFESDPNVKVVWTSDNADRFSDNTITIGEYGEGSVEIHLTVTLSKAGLTDEVRTFTVTVGSSALNSEGVVSFDEFNTGDKPDYFADSNPTVDTDTVKCGIVDNIDTVKFADHDKFFMIDQSATTGENIHSFAWKFAKDGENVKDSVYEASYDVYISDIATDGYCEAYVRGTSTIGQARFIETGGDYCIMGYQNKTTRSELVTAGSQWYTVKVVVDSTNLSNGTQPKVNYYLYDKDGELVSSLKNCGTATDFTAETAANFEANRIEFRPNRNYSKVKFYVDNLSYTNLTDLARKDAEAISETPALTLSGTDKLPVYGAHMTDISWITVGGAEGLVNSDGTINYNKFGTATVKVKAIVSAGEDLKGQAESDVITLSLTGTGSGNVEEADPSFADTDDFSGWNTQLNQSAVVDKADKTDIAGNSTTKIKLSDKAVFKVLDGSVGTGKVTFTADFLRETASSNTAGRSFRIYLENAETANAAGSATEEFSTNNIVYHLMDVGDEVYSVISDAPSANTAVDTDTGCKVSNDKWYRVVVDVDVDAKTATTSIYLHGTDGTYAPNGTFDNPISTTTTNLITKTPLQIKQIRLVRTAASTVYFDNVSLAGNENPPTPPTPGDKELGDVNGDGDINMVDVLTLSKHVAGYRDITFYEAYADIDGNGSIGMQDVLALSRKLSGYNKLT